MSPEDRVLFFVAERLQKSVVVVERMSHREVAGWLAWFKEAATAAAANAEPFDDAIDMRTLSKQQLRAMFK
jgi:hypothetical protein